MTECKYLYEFSYSCGHHTWEQLDRRLPHAEYYKREAGKCQACQKAQEKDAADKRAHWDERKRTCPVCGEAKILVETAKGVMCRPCRREKGMMDGKQGICDVCRMRLVLHYTGVAGRLMVCRHCWEKVTGKPAPAAWAPTSEKARAAK